MLTFCFSCFLHNPVYSLFISVLILYHVPMPPSPTVSLMSVPVRLIKYSICHLTGSICHLTGSICRAAVVIFAVVIFAVVIFAVVIFADVISAVVIFAVVIFAVVIFAYRLNFPFVAIAAIAYCGSAIIITNIGIVICHALIA